MRIVGELATGRCLCGAVRYEAKPRKNTAYYCHCRDCQIGSSSAFTVAVFVQEENFRIVAGELSTYSKIADSGRRLNRNFCPKTQDKESDHWLTSGNS